MELILGDVIESTVRPIELILNDVLTNGITFIFMYVNDHSNVINTLLIWDFTSYDKDRQNYFIA